MAEAWMKEFDDAMHTANEVASGISDANSDGMSKAQKVKLVAGIKRKISGLVTKADRLDELLQKRLRNQISEKELHLRQDLIIGLRFKIKQMTSNLNTAGSRAELLADHTAGPPVETSKTTGLDNFGLITYQRQTMKEQDKELAGLEESVKSTHHIALTVNEELDLHARLLDDLDQHVDHTSSRMRKVFRQLGSLSKRTGACSNLGCLCLMMLVIVALILIILRLVRVW